MGNTKTQTMTYKAIVIDDSSVHRLAITFLIKNHPQLEFVGAFADPYEGFEAIKKHKVDIVFLDVLLEDVTAFDVLDEIEIPSKIILNSSWKKFSERAKEYNIARFLMKPMRKDEFEIAVNDVLYSLEAEIRKKTYFHKRYLVRKPNVFQKKTRKRLSRVSTRVNVSIE